MARSRQVRHNTTAGAMLFPVATFASAFLIIFVQPMVGKHILPWFGGGPGVWTLCLAFYQSTLFLGYAYAHLVIARIPPARQAITHTLLFAAALAVLPVLPGDSWKPEGGADPSARILAMLGANVALPFLLLAATGPLLQAWFARAFRGRSPYPLYAVSNLGSLLALVSYPFAVEPHMPLSLESRAWSWGFAAVGLAVLSCAWLAARSGGAGKRPPATDADTAREAASGPGRGVLWVSLPACAVVLFMGVTNKLCLDVASVPFLWILPLSIYLLTFILCFGSERVYRRGVFIALAIISLLVLVGLGGAKLGPQALRNLALSIYGQIALYSFALFGGCMLAHGELYRLRPAPASLTSYYLCISGGGALGGFFVGIAAPRIFSGYHELSIALGACWLLVLAAWWRDPASALHAGRPRWAWGGLALLSAVVLGVLGFRVGAPRPDVLFQERNFFGVLRVFELEADNPVRRRLALRSGTTLHGMQFTHPEMRPRPLLYYGPLTGINFAMRQRDERAPSKVGVIGLGTGTLAAFGRKGDRFLFYEIDPDVTRIARDEGYFSYLGDSAADVTIIHGDARLSLESQLRDGGPQGFDLLIIDAFTSDSIPVHLLTTEAFQLYERHLRRGGALVVNVASVHLHLAPLVFRLGTSVGMHAVEIFSQLRVVQVSSRARWVVLSHEAAYIESLAAAVHGEREALGLRPRALRVIHPDPANLAGTPPWRYDYSDVFRILKPVSWWLVGEKSR